MDAESAWGVAIDNRRGNSVRIESIPNPCVNQPFWEDVPVAQLDRASASGAEGFVFESRRGYLISPESERV